MTSFLRSARLAAPLLAFTLGACTCLDDCRTVRATGPDETETRPVQVLPRVSVSSNVEVYLTQGTTPELRLEAPRNVLAVVRTEAVGGELRIGLLNGVNLKLQHPIRVYLTLPGLTALDGSGSSHFHGLTAWTGSDLTLTLSGASSADLDFTATGTLRSEASGASRLTLRGAAAQHTLGLSGASSFDGFNLTTPHTDLTAAGASTARLTATTTLAVRASGASEVYYQGNPSVTVRDLSGSSRLVKVE